MAQWVFETPTYGNEHAWQRREQFLRLDNNENTGPLPRSVRDALKKAVDARYDGQSRCSLYPDDTAATHAVAGYVSRGYRGTAGWPDCTSEEILLTNGCDQAIDLVLRAYCDASTTVLILRPTFPMYAHYLSSTSAKVELINYEGSDVCFEFPIERLLRRAGELGLHGERVILLLANPDNPSGVCVPPSFPSALREANRDALLIIDEAYFEFCPEKSLTTLLCLGFENLIFLRSMSKCFGLAGLRLGFIVGPREIVSGSSACSAGNAMAYLRKTRGPYDVNELALAAACAHLNDLGPTEDYISDVMTVGRSRTIGWLGDAGVTFAAGSANFCLVRGSENFPDLTARRLAEHGVLVRAQRFPLEANRPGEWFRMTYPRSVELNTLARALANCGVPV